MVDNEFYGALYTQEGGESIDFTAQHASTRWTFWLLICFALAVILVGAVFAVAVSLPVVKP